MTKSSITIRRVRRTDLPHLLPLVQSLAAFHDEPCLASLEQLHRDTLGQFAWMPTWVAVKGSHLVGYATLVRLAQLQFGLRIAELHHLYVADGARGLGIGSTLCTHMRQEAQKMEAAFLIVRAHDDNHAAHKFYLSTGAEPRSHTGKRFRWDLRLSQEPQQAAQAL